MSVAKGVVSSVDYTFNSTAKTITFSSNYMGISLPDIMYVTNVVQGVATVIYDPSDATKGGVLSGLTLTLAYDTSAMNNTDPLQIIVGMNSLTFNNSNSEDNSRNVAENIQIIADGITALSDVLDNNTKTTLAVDNVTLKKDQYNALIPSDCPIPINGTGNLLNGILFTVDTIGYQSIVIQTTNAGGFLSFYGSNDQNRWDVIYFNYELSTSNYAIQSSTLGAATIQIPCKSRYIRCQSTFVQTYPISIVAYLRQTPYSPPIYNNNILSIAGNQVSQYATGVQLVGQTNLGAAGNVIVDQSYNLHMLQRQIFNSLIQSRIT